jgi:hypothetical protein
MAKQCEDDILLNTWRNLQIAKVQGMYRIGLAKHRVFTLLQAGTIIVNSMRLIFLKEKERYMFVYICIYVYTVYTFILICIYKCKYICIYMYTCIYIYICIYTNICMYRLERAKRRDAMLHYKAYIYTFKCIHRYM